MDRDSSAQARRPHLRVVPDPSPQDGVDPDDPSGSPEAAGTSGPGWGPGWAGLGAYPPAHPGQPNHPAQASDLMAALPSAMLTLMDELTTTMFCLKDASGRYVAVNPTFVLRTTKRSARDVLGRTAGELFVPELAQRYEEQDEQIMATGRPLHNELELIVAPGGVPRWHLTTKVPVHAPVIGALAARAVAQPPVIGIVSMSQDLGQDNVDDPAMTSLHAVVHYIDENLAGPTRTADLARVAGCSPDTLERRVRRVFHRSPKQLVLTARIDAARNLLADRGTPIVTIAQRCGFYDQAAFSRTFARLTGLTPNQYRRRVTRR